MTTKRRWWNERTRMLLTLELAVVLPAAALIAYSVWQLRSFQRDKAVEAAIQRDFSYMLKIAEKGLANKTIEMVADARKDFPFKDEDVREGLDRVLEERPYLAHAFVVDAANGMIQRSNRERLRNDEWFAKEAKELVESHSVWMKMEAKGMSKRLRAAEEKKELPYYFYGMFFARGDGEVYENMALFPLAQESSESQALGGVIFDGEYLASNFFPSALNELVTMDLAGVSKGNSKTVNPVVMMIRPKKMGMKPIATSAHWDGGKPEVERGFEMAFPALMLAIKFKGTTIEAIGHKFLWTSFWIIGALSVVLAGGIWLTFWNVNREMLLAKTKSDFVANVSHELRTPLALIRLYAETLEMGRLTNPEKYEEYYRIIRKESERLTALINNILDFSRIEAGKKEYEFRETDLAELVRATMDSYRYQIEQNGFSYEEKIAGPLPTLRVDREAIARSLVNLVNNALKYSKDEKFVAVSVYPTNGCVKVEVEDRGIGIPRGEHSKIFEKFYRVGDPLVHNTKGSGLGLSLVRHIAQAHGGDVEVESVPGKGSKFTITLPVRHEPQPATSGNPAEAA